tara:strand:+ start:887 stop:1069 length:183 start_codon:yes stop_codon:yes gene_type:complete
MQNLENLFYLLIISLFLIIGGWALKACLSILRGEPIKFDILNPLNLKARWPQKNKKEKVE